MNYVVIYSGGMDSFTLLQVTLHHMRNRAHHPEFPVHLNVLSFDYGQRHNKELNYARDVCTRLGLKHKVIELGNVLRDIGGSALTDNIAVPEGHYAEESMRKTVVPGRNTIMLSIALAHAEALSSRTKVATQVRYGAHAGDHHIYPDCRPTYVAAMEAAMHESSDGMVTLQAPFLNINKLGILQQGEAIGLTAADYANTWTC